MIITSYKKKSSSKKNFKNFRNNQLNKKPLSEPTSAPTTTNTRTRSAANKKTAPVLVFDIKTGVVMDEATGNKYILKPINDNQVLINNIQP